jgi:hypothetical protein
MKTGSLGNNERTQTQRIADVVVHGLSVSNREEELAFYSFALA